MKDTNKGKFLRYLLVATGVLIVLMLGVLLMLSGTTSNEKQVKARYDGQIYAKTGTTDKTSQSYEQFDVAGVITNGFSGFKSEAVLDMDMAPGIVAEDGVAGGGMNSNSSSNSQSPAHGKKIAYTYDYTVESTEFDGFIEKLNDTLDKLGGYLESSRVDRREHDRLDNAGKISLRRGTYTIRVPAEKVHEVIELFSGENAQTTYENVRMLDKTAAYADAETQLVSYQREYTKLESLLDEAESVSDTIAIQDRLSNLNYLIEWAKKQIALIDEDVDYSTIDLELYEVVYYTASIESYKYEWGEALDRAFREFIYSVPEFLFAMIYLFIGVVVATGTVSLIVSMVVRRFEKRRGDRVLRIVDDRGTEKLST